jgi:hypothetical protein
MIPQRLPRGALAERLPRRARARRSRSLDAAVVVNGDQPQLALSPMQLQHTVLPSGADAEQ